MTTGGADDDSGDGAAVEELAVNRVSMPGHILKNCVTVVANHFY